ncbi:hypothetical protein Pfo_012822 [Paulownia fortunei]|nr:hypothetical protein Pfo_012822 [Paulownia fortunei]
MTIVEMRVHMDCPGCESKVMKALSKLDGVDDIDIDINKQKVTVMGWADQNKVLKTVRKTGRKAELWPFPYEPLCHDYYGHYYGSPANYFYSDHNSWYGSQANYFTAEPEYYNHYYGSPASYFYSDHNSGYSSPAKYFTAEPTSTYNYRKHGYNGHEHGYYQQPPSSAILDERTTTMFSDDNATGCSIM